MSLSFQGEEMCVLCASARLPLPKGGGVRVWAIIPTFSPKEKRGRVVAHFVHALSSRARGEGKKPNRKCSASLGAVLITTIWTLFLLPLANGQECPSGTVYLTFDTGNMAQAETIAAILKEENVKATFFLANERTVRGDRALDASWGGYWRARVAEGHAFGNHTWSHLWARRDLASARLLTVDAAGREKQLDRAAFCAELKNVDEAFRQLTGQRLAGIWRAPGGRTTQNSLRWAAACGYPVHVHWDEAGFLGDELPSDQFPNDVLLERALKNIAPGDVLLMHLGVWSRKEPFAPMLKPLIQGLKARGLCFATLGVARR